MDAEWEAFHQYDLYPDNGLQAAARTMFSLLQGDEDGDKERKQFYYHLLDSLQKDREILIPEGLTSTVQKSKRAPDDSVEYAAPPLR